MRKRIKQFFKLIVFAIVVLITIVFGSHFWIQQSTKSQQYNTIASVPHRKVGMVLGTSKRTVNGNINQYFKYRMEAAADLYTYGKVDYIIVSGDNSIKEYNETRDMKEFLMTLGVKKEHIVEDYAGFRTLDSVIRTKEVFGQDTITIISQKFHNERALFIANQSGINAIAYNAKSVGKAYGFRTKMREYLARVKAVLDLYILNTKPKYYKEKEIFPTDSLNQKIEIPTDSIKTN